MSTKKRKLVRTYKMTRAQAIETLDELRERLRDVNTHSNSPDEVEAEIEEIADLLAILSEDLERRSL